MGSDDDIGGGDTSEDGGDENKSNQVGDTKYNCGGEEGGDNMRC